ncbi:hypothetical protein WR25_08597 isoform A [Diploscapter pachys]|uniref:AMP-dependent synthetase/ligase domain-containing protein n=1 Tax=Diploscapter pachys TaxID=2018661 RepID=A0A2A2KNP0_9BILA|nr:hypothetical protein WR25_08597 isoform A [Diploscapter pachys]
MKLLSRNSVWKFGIRKIASRENNLTVRARMHEDPNKVFVIDDGKKITYGDFLKRAGQYVASLHQHYKISKGDRILARVSKNVDAIALYVACLRLGAIYVPLNPAYTKQETEHFVKDASPSLFVTCNESADKEFVGKVQHVLKESDLSASTSKLSPNLDVENLESDDVGVICYTSGTTGLPKGAMLTHGGLSSNAEALIDCWQFSKNDVQLHCLPFFHIHGLFVAFNCTIFSHSTLLWRPKFDVSDVIKHIPESTVMMGVPTYYSRLCGSSKLSPDLCKTFRVFICASAPLPDEVWKDFQKKSGHTILERYGMTEAQVVTSNSYSVSKRAPSVQGKPLKGVDVRITDTGSIEVKSPSLFKGYWKNPEKTAKDFTQDGYFITGDMGQWDKNENLVLLGRSKDVIITGGLNVYPKEVEDQLDQFDEIEESAVIGVPHSDFGEAVVGVIVLYDRDGDKTELEKRIIIDLKAKLAGYKVPRKLIFVKELPRNTLTKVQKNEMRKQYKDLFKS